MKKTHYQNIGFPKCGTSWLFGRLGNMFGITKLEKENKWQEAATTDEQFETEYLARYNKFEVTFNLNTQTYSLPVERIKKIHEYTTHLTMIIRNPWQLMESWYNYAIIPFGNEPEYIESLDSNPMFNFCSVYEKWSSASAIPVKIMFYDDLKETPIGFVKEICEYIGIHYVQSKSIESIARWYEQVNETKYVKKLPRPNEKLITVINNRITETERITKRNLNHWKNYA
jgi:hypothetical protein